MNAPPTLTRSELVVHGLADGLCVYVLMSDLWRLVLGEGWPDWTEPSLTLPVILLSATIVLRRFRPELRGLLGLELGLSGFVSVLGLVGAVATLVFMASGAS